MLLACCLLFGLALAENGVKITDFAVPSSVKAGENVELQCGVSLLKPAEQLFTVKWFLKSTNKPPQVLYQRLGNTHSTLPHKILWKGNETIEIVDMQPDYSGTYVCVASNYNEESREQDLVVYTPGTGPNLTITEVQNDNGDKHIQLTCTAEGVAPEPELYILIGKDQQSNGTLVDFSNATGEWSAATNATVPAIEADSTVSCELFYKNAKISHEQYIDRIIYSSSGGESSTTEMAETTIDITPAPQNGNEVQGLLSWWMVALVSCSLLLQRLV